MRISEKGILFIKAEEGFQANPKLDTDKMCWGYGHNRVGNEPVPISITLAEAEALLLCDIAPHELRVNQLASWANQNQFDALVDFAFNAGDGALIQLLAHGRDNIAAQMPRWVHATIHGQTVTLSVLVARRGREVALYNTPVSVEEAA